MTTKLVIATVIALSALGSASSFAMSNANHLYGEAANVVTPDLTASTLSRSQVKADYLAARQNGTLPVAPQASFGAPVATGSSLTRAEVRMQAAMSPMKDGGSAL